MLQYRSGFVAWTCLLCLVCLFFFFNDTATTEIYTLSLHDALPISEPRSSCWCGGDAPYGAAARADRKSTRLNSSHIPISYAVFCLKKKKKMTMRKCTWFGKTYFSSAARDGSCD